MGRLRRLHGQGHRKVRSQDDQEMGVTAGGLRRVHLGSLHRHAGKPSGGVITTSTTENEFKPEVKFLRKEQTNDRTNNTQTRSKLPVRL